MPEEKLLNIHQLCEIMGLKPQAARNLYKKYGLPVVRVSPTQIKFRPSDIDNFIKNHNVTYKPKD